MKRKEAAPATFNQILKYIHINLRITCRRPKAPAVIIVATESSHAKFKISSMTTQASGKNRSNSIKG